MIQCTPHRHRILLPLFDSLLLIIWLTARDITGGVFNNCIVVIRYYCISVEIGMLGEELTGRMDEAMSRDSDGCCFILRAAVAIRSVRG